MSQTAPASKSIAPVAPEILREQLMRPLPRVGLRAFIIFILVIALLGWSVQGTETSISTLVDGLPDVWNFIVRLFPPEFELARGTERTFINGGEELNVPISEAEDTLRRIFDADQSVYVYEGDQPVPLAQRDLSRTISILRADGLTTIRYVVGASGFTIGFPSIISAIVETIQMAIIGTLGAVILAIPVSLLAARNVSPHPLVYQVTRFILNILRSIPELIYGLVFVAAVGLGPFPGVLAIIFGSVGSLSRLFAEAIEQIDPQQVLAIQATGAGSAQTFIYAVLPQALPLLISYSLVYFEHNVRNATILGYVGAGGVGFEIQKYISLFQYDRLMGTVIVLVVAVTVIDRFSSYVRSRFI
ncbi:MAG: phosphonate ABC transporter, permease protein PhnE [Chloroflexota bacterium]|nr:phosphonate ABC transporter, permease protein PhnE [Chloroflexota bacterium]